MLFVTNRVPDQGLISAVGRPVSFADGEADATNSLFYCESVPSDHGSSFVEKMSDNFLKQLKTSNRKNILLYLHGFNNTPDSAIGKGHLLQRLLDSKDPNAVEVVAVVWPCIEGKENKLKAYWSDEDAADMSGIVFARVLSRFIEWQQESAQRDTPCLKRVNLLAHSMGNRVAMNTLHYWATNFGNGGVPFIFQNAFLIAADIPSNSLEENQPGEYISKACRNVSVYYAGDDKRMEQSVFANRFRGVTTSRLGDNGPDRPERVAGNVYRIDCNVFNSDFDRDGGHGYFLTDQRDTDAKAALVGGEIKGRTSPIIDHILGSIGSGRVEAKPDRTFAL
ncbi:alpha/beta hydrolase [Accumulibacter sp.]|uniref:alpha/beta hydrolase n=1 Tax=Accumulibacter sp. TaxID=2053492 RepID=UPI0025F23437|nr:alpha/beta hydrolase [Accumulibacter sp.]MCM8612500.1 alpha/beta hydrolase [Accumulibacter sp.]MCM8636393.1 alpha/beta hydrolase [Accumulibacter sp.]MCM8640077.1 alpha/beta hydrolase [Accumulibacter sp.]